MKILMVCLGNICRSPMAEGVLRAKAIEQSLALEIDSAGTANYHVGSAPDHRMCATAEKHGISINNLRARQFTHKDFLKFDLIVAMDQSNLENILNLAQTKEDKAKVILLLNELNPNSNDNVPDPYYGSEKEFEECYQIINNGMEAFINNKIISSK
jgi:protein-tyrosine phosphatase